MKCLIATHGSLGEALIDSTRMIVGDVSKFTAICLREDEGISAFHDNIQDFFELNKEEEILILCDIENGSPYIQTLTCAKKRLEQRKFFIVTGCNLPMMLEIALSGEVSLATLKESTIETGKKAIHEYLAIAREETDCLL